jgi:hypothetical protein
MKKANQQVEELKKQLLEAQALNKKQQLKNTALETMIDIAEKKLAESENFYNCHRPNAGSGGKTPYEVLVEKLNPTIH